MHTFHFTIVDPLILVRATFIVLYMRLGPK
jgi:hypothetical protein